MQATRCGPDRRAGPAPGCRGAGTTLRTARAAAGAPAAAAGPAPVLLLLGARARQAGGRRRGAAAPAAMMQPQQPGGGWAPQQPLQPLQPVPQQQAPGRPGAPLARPGPGPAAPVFLELSQVLNKQVVTRTSGRSLGCISGAWLDPARGTIVSFDLDDRRQGSGSSLGLSSAARAGNIPLSALRQIGDVVLVHDEGGLYEQDLDGRLGFVNPVGLDVRTRTGEFLGKVRDLAFSPDSGAVSRLTYDEFGLPFLPPSFFDCFSVSLQDVLSIGRGEAIVYDDARYRERKESSGLFAAIPSLLRSLNAPRGGGGQLALPAPAGASTSDAYRLGAGGAGGRLLPADYTYEQWQADLRRWEAETGMTYEQYIRSQSQQQQRAPRGALPAAGGSQQQQQQQQQQQGAFQAAGAAYAAYGAPSAPAGGGIYGAAAQPQPGAGYAPPQQQMQPMQQQQQQPYGSQAGRPGAQQWPAGAPGQAPQQPQQRLDARQAAAAQYAAPAWGGAGAAAGAPRQQQYAAPAGAAGGPGGAGFGAQQRMQQQPPQQPQQPPQQQQAPRPAASAAAQRRAPQQPAAAGQQQQQPAAAADGSGRPVDDWLVKDSRPRMADALADGVPLSDEGSGAGAGGEQQQQQQQQVQQA